MITAYHAFPASRVFGGKSGGVSENTRSVGTIDTSDGCLSRVYEDAGGDHLKLPDDVNMKSAALIEQRRYCQAGIKKRWGSKPERAMAIGTGTHRVDGRCAAGSTCGALVVLVGPQG